MPVNELDEYLFEKRQKLKTHNFTKRQTKFFTNIRNSLKFGEVLINVDFKGKHFASKKFELRNDFTKRLKSQLFLTSFGVQA